MKQVIIIFLFMGAHSSWASSASIFEGLKNKVVQVVTAIDQKAPKRSYGTGFYIDADRIVTNFHVVAAAVHNTGRYQVYLVGPSGRISVKIEAVDVTHDLAVLRTQAKVKSWVKFAPLKPTQGEVVYSLGMPEDLNMSIVSGTYNDVLVSGPYRRIHLSSPINSGMSGGPTVNKHGQLIGVNVAKMVFSENIGFAVPLDFVKQLILKKPQTLQNQIQGQLSDSQQELYSHLIGQWKRKNSIGSFDVSKFPDGVRCWSDREKHKDESRYKITTQFCSLSQSTYLSDKVDTISFRSEFYSLANTQLNIFGVYQLLNQIYAGHDQPRHKADASDTPWSAFKCQFSRYKTKSALSIAVEVCSRKLKKYKGVYDVRVKIMSQAMGQHHFVSRLSFNGFSSDQIYSLISKWTNGIRLNALSH